MEYHAEYAAINSRVHRKPALVVGSPALVRHVAFWKPFGVPREEWVKAADRYIVAVYLAIKKQHKGKPEAFHVLNDTHEDNTPASLIGSFDDIKASSRSRRFYLFEHVFFDTGQDVTDDNFRPIFASAKERIAGLEFRLGMDLTADQVPSRFKTVSFKFAYYGFTCWIKFELNHEYCSASIVLDFAILPKDISASELVNEPPVKQLQAVLDAIKTEIRGRYDAIVRNEPKELIGERRSKMIEHHSTIYVKFWRDYVDRDILESPESKPFLGQIGKVFYDTRGLLLRMNERPEGRQSGFITDLFPVAHSSSALETIQPDPFFTREGGFDSNICDAFWPFITALDKGKNDRVEYAASKLLNSRAIHITSLGNIPAAAQDVNVPVKFLLVTSLRNRWQIGRLIDRLFVLESSRVAALMNIEKISDASKKLDDDFVALRDFQENRSGSGRETQEQLGNFSRNLAKLGKESGCDGGLEYRIGRSRYYVAQFKEMMDTFRVDRIEGYQTFIEFTQRRFYTIYRSIEQLGAKLIAFRHQLDDLNDQIQAEQMLELSRLNNQRQDEIFDLQTVLIKLQVAAEMTLVLPLSYYSFHILETILEPVIHAPPWSLALLCLSLFGSLFWYRRGEHLRKLAEKIKVREAIKIKLGLVEPPVT